MDQRPLSVKQQLILDFLKQEIKVKGYPPTVREICDAVNLKSTSTVHAHLEALQKKQYIRRSPSKNRSIEILDEYFYEVNNNIVNVPIVGTVTAGEPILAVENIEDSFPVPMDFVSNDSVFMLRVRGDSMIEAGIHDKDLILIKKQNSANNGDIVVALIDDSATVKYFFKDEEFVRLEPANQKYRPIYLREVIIIGKVIGLYRKYSK